MTDLDDELRYLAGDLIEALRDEPVPPAILDLATRLQAALRRREAVLEVPANPE